MIARAARLAGAILIEGCEEYWLVGNTKEPCDWLASGFLAPRELSAGETPVILLKPVRSFHMEHACLTFEWNGDSLHSLANALADRLLIHRNGSVSERLWRLVTGQTDEQLTPSLEEQNASWLVSMPGSIWSIVRETVLKCL